MARAVELQARSWQLHAAGQLDEALAKGREALQIVGTIEGPASADAANLLNDLAEIECDRQQFQTGLGLVDQARQADMSEDDPTCVLIRIRTLTLGGTLSRLLGRYAAAEADLDVALRLAVTQFGDHSPEAAESRNHLGVLFKYCGRYDDGLRLYGEALRAIAARYGQESLEAATVLHNIGGIFHAAGRFAEAEGPARTAWQISGERLGPDDLHTQRDAVAYAAVLDGLARYAESEPIYRQALAIFERALGPIHDDVACTLHNLAEVLAARGDTGGAERHFRRALTIKEDLFGPDSHDAALTRLGLGRLLGETGRRDEAVEALTAVVHSLERSLAPGHPHLTVARRHLAAALESAPPQFGVES